MAGWRAGALIVLLMLTVVAMRGYLPGVAVPPPGDPPAGGGSPVVLLLLAESTALLVLLGVVGGRRSGRRRSEPREHRRGRRITWREAVVAAAIVVVAVVALGAPLFLSRPVDQAPERDRAPGTAQRPPAARPMTPPLGPAADLPSDTPFLVAAAVLLVGIAVLGGVVLTRGQAPPVAESEVPDDPRPPPGVSGLLARAAELGLAEVAEPGRDPRAAIIACYTAMERGLAEAPDAAPLASDTPSEVLARAVDHGALRAASAAPLVELFTEARFSPHRMTEAHRESAVRWLGAVLDDLRSLR